MMARGRSNKACSFSQKLGDNTSPFDVKLDKVEFWVQIHKIPRSLTNHKMAEIIGANLGSFVKADLSNFDGTWNAFIRVRVEIEVNKPLRRGLKIKQPNGESVWLECKYEHLPTFCFICGRLGHAEKYCPYQLAIEDDKFVKLYGPEMRPARRSTTAQANRWFRSELPSQSTPATEEGLGEGNYPLNEERIPRYEDERGQKELSTMFYHEGFNQMVEGTRIQRSDELNAKAANINVDLDNSATVIPPHSSVMDLLVNEQNRKRGAQEMDGPGDCNAIEDFMAIEEDGCVAGPNQFLEAGSAEQARLQQ